MKEIIVERNHSNNIIKSAHRAFKKKLRDDKYVSKELQDMRSYLHICLILDLMKFVMRK